MSKTKKIDEMLSLSALVIAFLTADLTCFCEGEIWWRFRDSTYSVYIEGSDDDCIG